MREVVGEYTTLSGTHPKHIDEQVMTLIRAGWQPYGEQSVLIEARNGAILYRYHQVMVKLLSA